MSGIEDDLTRLVCLAEALLPWYAKNARELPWRSLHPNPYHVWISEIMLQQTRVEAVKGYFSRFLTALPDPAALAEVTETRLLKLWEGLGYYNRARNLQKTAKILVEQFGGRLPDTYASLLELPGIGSYTAGAIASIAFGLPIPAVDGNVLRVYTRVMADFSDIANPRTKLLVENRLRPVLESLPSGGPGTLNQALMELGATVCVPNGPPACLICPAASFCLGHAQGIAPELPVKTAKKPRRIEPRTVLLLTRDERIAVRQRGPRGLLAGLWELPNCSGHLDEAELIRQARQMGLEPLHIRPLGNTKHIFTHVEWQMTGFQITVEQDGGDSLEWIDPAQRDSTYALPSAFRFYLREWKECYGEQSEEKQTHPAP